MSNHVQVCECCGFASRECSRFAALVNGRACHFRTLCPRCLACLDDTIGDYLKRLSGAAA